MNEIFDVILEIFILEIFILEIFCFKVSESFGEIQSNLLTYLTPPTIIRFIRPNESILVFTKARFRKYSTLVVQLNSESICHLLYGRLAKYLSVGDFLECWVI